MILVQRLRRWPNIAPALFQRFVLTVLWRLIYGLLQNTRYVDIGGLILGHRLQRWPCIQPAFVQHVTTSKIRKRWPNAVLMLGHCLRRWPSIKPALVERVMFAGICHCHISLTQWTGSSPDAWHPGSIYLVMWISPRAQSYHKEGFESRQRWLIVCVSDWVKVEVTASQGETDNGIVMLQGAP